MSTTKIEMSSIDEALEELAAGRMVVVVDDEDRENEGDLVMAAQFVPADDINFMTRQAGGWICLALTPERCDELGLELMTLKNESAHQTPFTVTIEAREGVTTGISTADQAHTMQVAVDVARVAGLNPAGVICEIQNEDGSMAHGEELAVYCFKHGLKMVSIADL